MPLATRVAHTLDRLGDAVAAAHLADWNGTRADRDHSNVAVLDSVASRGAPTDLLALEKCLREGKGGGQRASESAWLTESELAQAMRIAWRERSADAGRMVALELLLRQQETRLHPQLGACLVRFSIAAAPVPDTGISATHAFSAMQHRLYVASGTQLGGNTVVRPRDGVPDQRTTRVRLRILQSSPGERDSMWLVLCVWLADMTRSGWCWFRPRRGFHGKRVLSHAAQAVYGKWGAAWGQYRRAPTRRCAGPAHGACEADDITASSPRLCR
jgi:hypothetical protein